MVNGIDLQSVDKLLTTTRSVRKRLDLDRPVPPQIIADCLELAIQAPTGGNGQHWHFMVVTEAEKLAQIGAWYKESFDIYNAQRSSNPALNSDQQAEMKRVISSAVYLSTVMHRVPAMVIPCYNGRVEDAAQMSQAGLYGSILPATWSLMMALRARGLGSAWTTLHLRYADKVAELLGIPAEMTQAALLPVAYYTGEDFRAANRVPSAAVTSWNQWGNHDK